MKGQSVMIQLNFQTAQFNQTLEMLQTMTCYLQAVTWRSTALNPNTQNWIFYSEKTAPMNAFELNLQNNIVLSVFKIFIIFMFVSDEDETVMMKKSLHIKYIII